MTTPKPDSELPELVNSAELMSNFKTALANFPKDLYPELYGMILYSLELAIQDSATLTTQRDAEIELAVAKALRDEAERNKDGLYYMMPVTNKWIADYFQARIDTMDRDISRLQSTNNGVNDV